MSLKVSKLITWQYPFTTKISINKSIMPTYDLLSDNRFTPISNVYILAFTYVRYYKIFIL